jgi:hypothetical protein
MLKNQLTGWFLFVEKREVGMVSPNLDFFKKH